MHSCLINGGTTNGRRDDGDAMMAATFYQLKLFHQRSGKNVINFRIGYASRSWRRRSHHLGGAHGWGEVLRAGHRYGSKGQKTLCQLLVLRE